MEQSIQTILENHKVKGVFHTHVSMGVTKGKYQFNRQDLEEFWKIYGNTITDNPETVTGIAEKPQHYLPVLGDIDIKIKETDEFVIEGELHTEKHTRDVIEVYQSVLRKIVEDCTDEHLICVLLEKPLYRVCKNNIFYAKHGFHIHFPYCFLNKVDQEVHLIPRVQESLKDLKIFQDLGIEDSGLMVDKSCCKVPWLLYGSRKEYGMDPYLVSKIINSEGNEISMEEAFKNYPLYDMSEKQIKIKGKVKEFLPRILSIIPYGRSTCELKNGLISPLKEQINDKKKSSEHKEYSNSTVSQFLDIAKQLLPMLSDYRTQDRNEWMTVGWILFNIGEGSYEALELWCDFSSRCEDQYDESVCIYQWERMTKKDLTLGTLRYYASVDSPEKYKEFKKEQATKFIYESLNGSHNDVAKTLYAEYGNEFVCASIAGKSWFQFYGHKWEQIEDGIFLREKISGEIVDRYTLIGKEIFSALAACTEKGNEAMCNVRLKQAQKMIGNLKSAPYKNNVMKECICEGTLVSLSNGLSIPIEELYNYDKVGYNIFGWDKDIDKLTVEKQIDFMKKGEKQCIELTLEDGTTISTTENHMVLVLRDTENIWVNAGDLNIGDLIKTGIKLPHYNPTKEITECNEWCVQLADYKFSTNTLEDYEKTLCLARVLGYILTDEYNIKKNTFFTHVSIAFKFDAITFQNDLNTVLSKFITNGKNHLNTSLIKDEYGMYVIKIPSIFSKCILSLVLEDTLPLFLLDVNCPLPIIREFLGSMLGKNGYNNTKYLEYSCNKSQAYLNNIKNLLERFDLNQITLFKSSIRIHDILLFSKKIGYRYCINKAYKLSCISSYLSTPEKQSSMPEKEFSNKKFLRYMDKISSGKKYFCSVDVDIQVFSQKLIKKQYIGIKKVYDITVNNVHSFIANGIIVHNCQEVFYDKRFREKLDTNPALFPFKNGVYDLNTNIFRPGRPEDFISKTAPIDYIEFDEDDEKLQDVYEYLEKVFPDKSIRDYFMDTSSDIFYGGNHQKHVYFWTGEGDNAKSVTQNIFEKMLGHLSIKFNTTVITGKKVQSGSANPELARAGGGVRLATLEEPNSDEMINIGIMKNLSGNDSYYARDLFEKGKEGREIQPLFKLVFICNKLPKLRYSDKAVWNRIRVIPFESTFCRPDDPAPSSYEEQLRQKRFPMDKDFSSKIPDMVQAFAWILLRHRINLKDRVEPEKVRMATAIYRKQNDIYRQFIEECVMEEKNSYINLIELYSQFKDWFKDSLPGQILPIKNEVEEYFSRLWDEPEKGKKWKGYRIRNLQDDIDNGDAIVLDDSDLVNYEEDGLCLPAM